MKWTTLPVSNLYMHTSHKNAIRWSARGQIKVNFATKTSLNKLFGIFVEEALRWKQGTSSMLGTNLC